MARQRSDQDRVVITGTGAITPLGLTVAELWDALAAGRSGIGPITHWDASDWPVRLAGEIKGFDPTKFISRREARRLARCTQVTVAAAHEAVAQSGLPQPFDDPERVGVLIGSTLGGFERIIEAIEKFWEKGLSRVSPFAVTAGIPNMPTHYVSHAFQALGYITTLSTACATGTQSLGEAAEVIRRGAADVMIAGGVEAVVNYIPFAGFIAVRALSTRNDEPERASRPFDAERDGFVISEGVGLMVLERLSHAKARGAQVLGEVLGYAASTDAFHEIAPDPNGIGASRAIRWALENAGVGIKEIDYVNAHAAGTPLGDVAETKAIKLVFGERAYQVPVSSTKSMIGHCFAGAGAIESIATLMTLRHGIIPPTLNYETPDPECDLDYVPNTTRKADVKIALKNSFGMGGQNACLVLGRYEA
jgi:beta-ketoacyl-acyl-carrier-protein synthase II